MVSTQHEFTINSFIYAVKNTTVAATRKSRIVCPSRKPDPDPDPDPELDPDPDPEPEPGSKPCSTHTPKHYSKMRTHQKPRKMTTTMTNYQMQNFIGLVP